MSPSSQYEVLSPWAEADPIQRRSLTPRLTTLEGKKIGLLINNKRAAAPIQDVVQKQLKTRFPTSEITFYKGQSFSVSELEPQNKDKFEDWIREVDTVVLAVGD
jgi:alpha-ketoglutarate-dependent taurine dioxygenase